MPTKLVKNEDLNVWIVDDDLVSLFATKYGIEQSNNGCSVIDFDNARMALELLSLNLDDIDFIPDIILLDLAMPDMDGWDFLREFEAIRHRPKKTDIYILSAFTNTRDRKRAKEHTLVKGYFDKPVHRNDLDKIFKLK